MTSTTPQILLTGSTGYIGGTILTQLLKSSSPKLSAATITCLVRGPERVAKLSSTYGDRVRPVVYKDLDDLEATTAAAAQHDIVISATLGFHTPSVLALLRGLAQRKASTGRDVWLIHTSGTSNLADQPVSGAWLEEDPEREFDDAKDDIYGYEKEREALHQYPQRSTELSIVDAGLELGVKTLVIMSPTIYGLGTGLFHTTSLQLPMYIHGVLNLGRPVVVGDGKGVWDHVHVEDVADLYKIAVVNVLENGGKSLPTGKEGIIFSGNGRHTWMEAAQLVTDVLYEEGKFTEKRVPSIGLSEGLKVFAAHIPFMNEHMFELALCSNARTVATVAARLGWKPTRGEEAWKAGIRDDVHVMLGK